VKIINSLQDLRIESPVVTIGVFDGVHKGHRHILKKVIEDASHLNGESTVITFWPHPRIILNKDARKLRLLNTIDEKINLLERLGINNLVILPFTREFAALSACEFTENYLVNKLGTKKLIVGYNHHFGKNREGDYDQLKDCAIRHNFQIERLPAFEPNGEKISSTIIRNHLENGAVKKANTYLGYSYPINGYIVSGNQIGRKIGFPTANIQIPEAFKQIPALGVYAVKVFIREKVHYGMLNIGIRPTLQDKNKGAVVEVHIFNFDRAIYHENIKIEFIDHLREEKKFNNLKELSSQLAVDKMQAEKILNAQ